MRCGARFPAGARRWGEAGRGLRAPLPARAPSFPSLWLCSECARGSWGGWRCGWGLGGERLGMGNEKGRCQKESEEEVAVLGKDALRPPFRPLGAGGCQEVAQMRGAAAREALRRDLGTALRPSVAQGSRRACCSLPSWWLSGAQAAGARGQGLGCFGNREQRGAGRAACPPNRAS